MYNKIEMWLPEMTGQGIHNWFVRSKDRYFNPATNEMEYMFLTVEGTVMFDDPMKDLTYFYFTSENEAFKKRNEYLENCEPMEIDSIGSQPLFED